jgi:hypothetical protein
MNIEMKNYYMTGAKTVQIVKCLQGKTPIFRP